MLEIADIRLTQEVAALPVRVWEALIRPALWWNEGVTLEPRLGGRFFEPWSSAGVEHQTFGLVTALEPPRLLAMTWKDADWTFDTLLTMTIEGRQDVATLSLRHQGWEGAPAEHRARLIGDHRSGWVHHLKSLAACAESMSGTTSEASATKGEKEDGA